MVAIPVGAIRRIVLGALILGVVGVLALLGWQLRERVVPAPSAVIDGSMYQAVFLVTNQVYFGKLQVDGDRYLLSDVYYLSQPADPNVRGQLVKRGTELHAPKDPMIIPARSVLFIENMRDDSEVALAIRQQKSGQGGSPATPPPATVVPSASARPSPSR